MKYSKKAYEKGHFVDNPCSREAVSEHKGDWWDCVLMLVFALCNSSSRIVRWIQCPPPYEYYWGVCRALHVYVCVEWCELLLQSGGNLSTGANNQTQFLLRTYYKKVVQRNSFSPRVFLIMKKQKLIYCAISNLTFKVLVTQLNSPKTFSLYPTYLQNMRRIDRSSRVN